MKKAEREAFLALLKSDFEPQFLSIVKSEFKTYFDKLSESYDKLSERIHGAEGKILRLQIMNQLLERKHENLEQYGRRVSLRVGGIRIQKNETPVACLKSSSMNASG